ncbi:hypothetical protein [Streptomyces sp. UH6]|uniref:hypothetical protein n=1 Tax=Streptomyces sp. UH6 TaxID=2748379 RepID=UPI0015D4C831|nr:hypothetical protein [Streptomyces sp. UH6]NYV76929.1 hypothetical protein [Streptomyces sp. UH6]
MKADAFIDAVGGIATREDFPEFIEQQAVEAYLDAVTYARTFLSDYDRATDLTTRVELANSPFFTCRSKVVDDGRHILVVPLGLVCRLHVLGHLLLGYWGRDGISLEMHAAQNSLLPQKLTPLFGAATDADDRWGGLRELHALVHTPSATSDVQQLTYQAMMFIIGHEGAHVYRRHAATLRHLRDSGLLESPRDEEIFRRFAEIDADTMATYWTLDAQWMALKANQTHDDDAIKALGYMRVSYAVTMLFALFDVHRNEIGSYESSVYVHPIIRRHLFTEASAQLHESAAWRTDRHTWTRMELRGWRECVRALGCLNLDILTGRFGEYPDLDRVGPASALQYKMTQGDVYQRYFDREVVLYTLMRSMHESVGRFKMAGAEGRVLSFPKFRNSMRIFMKEDPLLDAAVRLAQRVATS